MSADRPPTPDLPRVTFWPRPGARDGPIQRDVYCEKCGYNLRGLKEPVCPECGATFNARAFAASQLPWKQREVIGFLDAYWRTVKLVLVHPRRFGNEVWDGGRISAREAGAFRWITILHAQLPLMALWLSLAGPHLSQRQLIPFTSCVAVLLLLWLNRSTKLLVMFFNKQTMSADVQRRVVALSHFACAALALSPIHLACLALAGVAYKLEGKTGKLFAAAVVVWATFLMTQLLLWWINSLLLVRETMRIKESELAMIGMGFAALWALHAAFWLGLIPFVFYTAGAALRMW